MGCAVEHSRAILGRVASIRELEIWGRL